MGKPESGEAPKRSRSARFLVAFISKTALIAWGTLIGSTATALIIKYDLLEYLSPPTASEQLDALRSNAAANLRYFAILEKTRLHGSNAFSYLVVLRHNSFLGEDPSTAEALSDEVRIYDLVDDELVLAFQFRPRPEPIPESEGRPYVFRLDKISDINGDGVPEVVASFSPVFMEPLFPRPIVIAWDPAQGEYQMAALLNRPPDLVHLKRRGLYGGALQRFYRHPDWLEDQQSGTRLRAFAVEAYAVELRNGLPPILVAAYVARARFHASVPVLQVIGWSLRLSWPNPDAYACRRFLLRPLALLKAGYPGAVSSKQLLQFWEMHTREGGC